SRVMFPAFAKLNGIDPDSVRWVDMTPPARAASLVLGQVDAVVLFLTEGPTFSAKAKEAGKHWKDFPYADYGLDLYSHGLLVRDDLIANQPDRVKRFIEATTKAWAWSIENPQEALAIFLKHNPAVDPDQAREHFRIAIKHLLTDTAKREGIGYIDAEKMRRTVDFVSQHFNIKGVSADDVYTNRFTPKLFPNETAFQASASPTTIRHGNVSLGRRGSPGRDRGPQPQQGVSVAGWPGPSAVRGLVRGCRCGIRNNRRPQRLRQKHAVEDHRWSPHPLVRVGHGSRPRRHRALGRCRDGVSTSRAAQVAYHFRQRDAADRNVAPAAAGEPGPSSRSPQTGRPSRLSPSLSRSAFGRHAAASRHLPRIDP